MGKSAVHFHKKSPLKMTCLLYFLLNLIMDFLKLKNVLSSFVVFVPTIHTNYTNLLCKIKFTFASRRRNARFGNQFLASKGWIVSNRFLVLYVTIKIEETQLDQLY